MTASLTDRFVRLGPKVIGLRGAIAVFLILCPVACSASAEPNASGTYVYAEPTSAALLVMVQTPDGRVTGRLEAVSLGANGALQNSAVTLEGAADGSSVLLTPKSILLSLGNPPSLSGVIEDDAIDLSWQGGHGTFQRAEGQAFRDAISVLQQRSVQIVTQAALGKATADALRLGEILEQVEAHIPSLHAQLTSASDRYRELFNRMHRRRRAHLILSQIPDQDAAGMAAGTEAQGIQVQIDAVSNEIAELRGEWHSLFEVARTLTRSVDAYCSTGNDASRQPPCLESAAQHQRFDRLKSIAQDEFDGVQAAYQGASIDVPPGRQMIENLTGQ